MLDDFDPQQALLRVCSLDSFQLKPHVINLTLDARILFQFMSQNMIPQGGHRDAPTFCELSFVDPILHFNIPPFDEAECKLWTIDIEINNKTFSFVGFSFLKNEWVAKTKQGHNQNMEAQQEASGSHRGTAAEGVVKGAHAEKASTQGFDFHEAFNSLSECINTIQFDIHHLHDTEFEYFQIVLADIYSVCQH
ncbi:hypothetical protein PanWU01x14_047180 [Parasponia andersonii]|uniref:Uncharacterized protein n=1 Tax=Parasponia andersonii TaxID=3476 RepID=A0A2P5DNY8_PARAD|nr:hypothetical protein PanWU01x14_047180 [Parasponia andersonii]